MRRAATLVVAAAAAATLACLALPVAAFAAPPVGASLNPADWLSDAAGAFKDVVLGPLEIGVEEVAGLLVNVLTALADLLVPDWLVKPATKLMTWIVAVPNWAQAGGTGTYVFSGVNNLHDYMRWFGVGLLTAGATWGATSGMLGGRAPEDIVRALMTAAIGLVFYRWGWGQLAAITNTITESLMSAKDVQRGLSQMLAFTAGGAFLSVGTIFAPILVIVAAVALLGLIAAKAALILLSAVVYVTGGLVLGLLVWPGGRAIAGAWMAMAGACFVIPVLWAVLFAVSGVLMSDAMKSGGQLIEGEGLFAGLMTQIMLAITSIVALVLAIKLAGVIWGMARSVPLGLIGGGGGKGGASMPGEGKAREFTSSTLGAGQARAQLLSVGDSLAGAAGLGSLGQMATSATGALAAGPLGPLATAVGGFASQGVWGPLSSMGTAGTNASSSGANASNGKAGAVLQTVGTAGAAVATGGAAAPAAAAAAGGAGAGAGAAGAGAGAAAGAQSGAAAASPVTATTMPTADSVPVASGAGPDAQDRSGSGAPTADAFGPAAPVGEALRSGGDVYAADGPPRATGADHEVAAPGATGLPGPAGAAGDPAVAGAPITSSSSTATPASDRSAAPPSAADLPLGSDPAPDIPPAPSAGRFTRQAPDSDGEPPNPAQED